MQLTPEERDALERYRNGHCEGLVVLADAVLRLFPVRTYGDLVIRWDDPVTPERLVACGFTPHGPDLRAPCPCRLTYCTAMCSPIWFCEYRIQGAIEPRNMLDVWSLMDRCGISEPSAKQEHK